jgi:hypothetical protein
VEHKKGSSQRQKKIIYTSNHFNDRSGCCFSGRRGEETPISLQNHNSCSSVISDSSRPEKNSENQSVAALNLPKLDLNYSGGLSVSHSHKSGGCEGDQVNDSSHQISLIHGMFVYDVTEFISLSIPSCATLDNPNYFNVDNGLASPTESRGSGMFTFRKRTSSSNKQSPPSTIGKYNNIEGKRRGSLKSLWRSRSNSASINYPKVSRRRSKIPSKSLS